MSRLKTHSVGRIPLVAASQVASPVVVSNKVVVAEDRGASEVKLEALVTFSKSLRKCSVVEVAAAKKVEALKIMKVFRDLGELTLRLTSTSTSWNV